MAPKHPENSALQKSFTEQAEQVLTCIQKAQAPLIHLLKRAVNGEEIPGSAFVIAAAQCENNLKREVLPLLCKIARSF